MRAKIRVFLGLLLPVFAIGCKGVDAAYTAETARGAHAYIQIDYTPKADMENVRLNIKGIRGIKAEAGLVGAVGISGKGKFPDPIFTDGPFTFKADTTYNLWIDAYVPADEHSGVYKGYLKVSSSTLRDKIPVSITVWPVMMAEPQFASVNWAFDRPDLLKLWNNGNEVDRYSEDYWLYVRQIAKALKGMHQGTIQIPTLDLIDQDGDGFDFSNFDKWVEVFREEGALKQLQGDEFGRRARPEWECPDFALYVPTDTAKLLLPIEDSLTVDFYGRFLPTYIQHLKDLGVYDNFVQRLCDEPLDANAEGYRKVAEFVKGIAPDLKIIEALQTTKLEGVVDVQVPQLDKWHENFDYFDKCRQNGETVWFYTCCQPRGKYPNRFIEQSLTKARSLFWLANKYGADGYLHWGFNYWNDKPYEQTDVPGAGIDLPGGDSWIVYPGNRNLVKSRRYCAVRDGIEDYTLLQMLAERNPERAAEICNMVAKDWLDCGEDEAAMASARHLLLQELSKKE